MKALLRSSALAAATVLLALACSRPPEAQGTRAATSADAAPEHAEVDAQPAHDAAPNASAPVDAGQDAAPEAPPPGADFTPHAVALFKVAACGGDRGALEGIPAALVDAHCKELAASYAEYKRSWIDVATPFLAKLRPSGLPDTVVYPFGGGDLVSALATFPDARELTLVSLEPAGDPRGVLTVKAPALTRALRDLRKHLGKLFLKAHSRTDNLGLEAQSVLPGEVVFAMAALVVHGYEPVSLRYFTLEEDGRIRYVTDEDVKDPKAQPASLFKNAELRFKRPGDARSRVMRHVAYDLSDANLKLRPHLMKHLEAKGKVSAMTKAASHLLWDDSFSTIREYLLTHMEWMISDTTGIPPRRIRGRGFVHDVYGVYEWPETFGLVNNRDATDFKELFKGKDPIPFRYGYPDNRGHGHIVVTRKGS